MPERLAPDETVEVVVIERGCQQEEALAKHLLGELADQVVAPAGGSPQQVATLGWRRVDQQLKLVVGQDGETLGDLACEPVPGRDGAGLKEVVLFDELADLGPVVLAEVDGGGDEQLPA